MTNKRPLKILQSGDLQEFSDTEIEYVNYEVRKFYAKKMLENDVPFGTVTGDLSSSYPSIGTMTDHRLQVVVRTDDDDSTPEDYVTDPISPKGFYNEWESLYDVGLANGLLPNITEMSIVTTSSLLQRSEDPINDPFPTIDTLELNNYSYLYYDDTTNSLRIAKEQEFFDALIQTAQAELSTGDEVGSLRVSTSSPGSDWEILSNAFLDTRFNYTIRYYIYIKTKDSSSIYESMSPPSYISYDNSGDEIFLKEKRIIPLIERIYYIYFQKYHPIYEIQTTNLTAGSIDRGQILNTSYSTDATTYEISGLIPGGVNGYYRRTDYPSTLSTIVTRTSYYFALTGFYNTP